MIKKQRQPKTLNERIEFISNKLNVPPLTNAERIILGKALVELFYSEANKCKYKMTKKVQIIEDGVEMTVLQYPAYFVPVMDRVINNLFKNKQHVSEGLLRNCASESTGVGE